MLLLPVLIALVACDNNNPTSTNTPTAAAVRQPYDGVPEGKPKSSLARIPDPNEVTETLATGQLPDFLSKVAPTLRDKVAAQYQGAVDHYAEYNQLPCYCGCAVYEHAHMSVASCFIKEKKDTGEIVFTDHSTSCDTCQGVAQMALDGLAKSRPIKDIRADVFEKFSYTGIWTDTPLNQ